MCVGPGRKPHCWSSHVAAHFICFFQIKDGYDIIGRHCGSFLPPLLVSDSSIVKLKFHTDHKEEGEGFNATFRHISGKLIDTI